MSKPRILLVAKPWKGGLADYLLNALKQRFAGAVTFVPTYPSTLSERYAYWKNKHAWRCRLVDRINSTPYDAAIFVNHLSHFESLAHTAKNVLWLVDGPQMTARDLRPFARFYLSDPGYASDLPQTSTYAGELPFAHDPGMHVPYPVARRKQGLCFIGNKDLKRSRWLDQMFNVGLMPTVYGNYFLRDRLFWDHPRSFRPAIPTGEMGRIYAKYQVALNIHAEVIREGTNMRTFECAGYGIPQLVESRPGLEKFFEPEHEILVFSSLEECMAQCERLVSDEKSAIDMAERARQRALAEHTYRHRVATLLEGIL
jgi:spore maturation protein CgeB